MTTTYTRRRSSRRRLPGPPALDTGPDSKFSPQDVTAGIWDYHGSITIRLYWDRYGCQWKCRPNGRDVVWIEGASFNEIAAALDAAIEVRETGGGAAE